MADYKNYLAASILSEDKVVTYRLLSRALKVHVNAAKEMLYEFHRQQNGKKPGTVHATYLISGAKRITESVITNGRPKKDGEDEYMQSSPPISSSMPQPEEGTAESSVLSISLTREEDLENVRSQYEHISSIHIYSLGPSPLKDLQMLSDVTREIQELCGTEDPIEFAPKYGTIVNKGVKRRTARRPPPVPAVATTKPQPPKSKSTESRDTSKPSGLAAAAKQETPSSQPSSAKDFFGKGKEKSKPAATSNGSSQEASPNPPALKRDSSSIFKSFAKAKPKLEREGTDSSVAASPAPNPLEDQAMKDVSDDEEDTYVAPPQAASKEIVDSDRKSRKEREAALKKMMEDDDEDEPVARPDTPEVDEPTSKAASEEPNEKPPVVSGGRRRGKRRVMKKKTVRDEEGYLVTKEEAVWESFSEDEPVAAPKAKVQPTSTTAKPKKTAAKPGHGNIMAFFGKK